MSSHSKSRRTARAVTSDHLPEVPHPDAGITLSSEWLLGTAQRQREAAERIVDAWRQRTWPEGLYSYALFLADDGDILRHYSQWRDEAAFTRFQATFRDERLEGIDTALPGIVRRTLDHYRVYRSVASGSPTPPDPFVVVTTGEADSPTQLRAFIDALLAKSDDSAPTGDSGGFIAEPSLNSTWHINLAGTQALNYMVWTDEAAFDAAMAAPGGPDDPTPLRNPAHTRLQHFATLLPED